jgi:hypothetical protein
MMTHKLPRFSRCLYQTGIALLLVGLYLLSAQTTAAQPGDRRTPQEIKRALEAELTEIEKQLNETPDAKYLYESRGKVLTDLFRKSQGRVERDSFAERAFADFDTYELLTGGSALLPRAELHQLIWFTTVPDQWGPKLPPPPIDIEAFRNSPHFERQYRRTWK